MSTNHKLRHSRPLMTRVKPKMDERPDVRNLLPGFEIFFEDEDINQDLFSTPKWATKILLDNVKFNGTIWEPACGIGAMSKCLETKYKVVSTDLIDRGFGTGGMDFLTTDHLLANNIVTNPPYSFAREFVEHALEMQPAKTAFLLRTLFLETGTRYEMFKKYPPVKVIVISDRVMFNESERPGGCWCLSWFIWEHGHKKGTQLEWARWTENITQGENGNEKA